MAGADEPTLAAGGIVVRDGMAGTEVLVVHRPRYDDWSLPKGHLDPDETALDAALREVFEETGYRCAAGPHAGIAAYTTLAGEHKVVHYWVMTVATGSFRANDEVDEIRWAPVAEAVTLLSYDLDRDLLRTTLRAP